MREQYDIDALRGMTPATIRAAFNNADEILEEYGDMGSVNATGIMTKIMHAAGTLNERWATDALYGLDKIRALSDRPFALDGAYGNFDEIITFGVREDGVDHNAYIMSHLLESRRMPSEFVYPKTRYRKILAVRMRAYTERDLGRVRVNFSLRDITDKLHSLDPADLTEDKFHLVSLPLDDKTSPAPTDEKDRIDKAEIAKARCGGYTGFGSMEVHPDVLESEGCGTGVRCIEIGGLYPPIVPAPKNPHDNAVCRVYAFAGKIAVCWIDRWYVHYDNAKAEVEKAKAALLARQSQGQ